MKDRRFSAPRSEKTVNILSVTPNAYMPQFRGGLETVIFDFDKIVKEGGHGHAVLSGIYGRGFSYTMNRVRAKILRTNYPKESWKNTTIYRGWSPFHGIEEVTENAGIDIVLLHASGWINEALNEKFRKTIQNIMLRMPVFCYIHDLSVNDKFIAFLKEVNIPLIANSNYVAEKLRIMGVTPRLVVPPFVDLSRYRCVVKPRYLLVTNVAEVKGVDIAIYVAEKTQIYPFFFWRAGNKAMRLLQRSSKKLSILGT